LTYLLESGSDRMGALDFQSSATDYIPRGTGVASLEELLEITDRVEAGRPITPELEQAFFHGSSIGGARPKALIEAGRTRGGGNKKYIAKFSSRNDVFNEVKAEFVAMRLAERTGLKVAPVALENVAGRDVLLIERFDRTRSAQGWRRKAMVSALTLFGLDEMMARYASYETLADIIRHRFTEPTATLRELYGRLVFNILCGNTDDHARNHAAFWNGRDLTLTPAYDICPQRRAGREASQAMLIAGNNRESKLVVCIEAAGQFLLSKSAAEEMIELQLIAIRDQWPTVCEQAELTRIEQNALWRRQILNPFIFEDAPKALARFENVRVNAGRSIR